MKSSNSAARLAAVSRSNPYILPAKLRNSAPVKRPKRAIPSGTTPIWRLTSAGWVLRSSPRISIRPELGASNPVSILMVVDLPAPLGPRKPKNCPGATRRFTPSTAMSSPKRRVRDWVEMLGAKSIGLPESSTGTASGVRPRTSRSEERRVGQERRPCGRRHTRYIGDWSSDVCSSDLGLARAIGPKEAEELPGSDAEIHAVHGDEFSEATGQGLGGDAGCEIHRTSRI